MKIHDYFASAEDRRAFFHATLTADAKGGKPYDNEYIFVLSFHESGEKVTRITEMLDSVKPGEIMGRLREAGLVGSH